MKTDLKDTTFIIPVRLDSIIRLENLILTVDCIQKYFDTNIFILEASSYCNNMIFSLLKEVTYWFVEDKDPVFYRTKYLNEMTRKVKTDIIAIWDSDIIVDAEQIWDSVQQLRSNNFDVAFPYNGDLLDISSILRKHYWNHRDIKFLKTHSNKMATLYKTGSVGAVGGAILLKTENYVASGMENEDFYGWGMEDGERYYRWLELSYKIYRNKNCMFHLSHPRDLNGMYRSENHRRKAIDNLDKILNYGKEELNRKFNRFL